MPRDASPASASKRNSSLPQHNSEGLESEGVIEEDAAFQAISAALQLFDLCSPAEDSTISGADLENALQSHLGREDDVSRIRNLLNEHESDADRYNFLSYWRAVDRFFEEAGAFPKPSGDEEIISTIQGMRKFRDGVLQIHGQDRSQEAVPATLLLGLLHEIRASADDSAYWDEVIQAIPDEEGFGLTMSEVAEAVYIWLKDFTRGEVDGAEQACSDQESDHDSKQPAHETHLVPGALPPRGAWMEVMPMGRTDTEATDADRAEESTYLNSFRPKRKTLSKQFTSAISCSWTLGSFDWSAGLALHMQRAVELTDLIGQRTPPDEEVVQHAVERLVELHKIFVKAWEESQSELSTLQKSLDALTEKKEAVERDLGESLRHAGDLDHRFEGVERQRDENLSRVAGLETQVRDLLEQRDLLSTELRKIKVDTESHQREKSEVHRKTVMLQSRLLHVEKHADTAEGQVSWMRCELEKLRRQLKASRQAVRSYAGCYREAEEVASLLQQQAICEPSFDHTDAKGPAALPNDVVRLAAVDAKGPAATLNEKVLSDASAALSQDVEELEKQLGLQHVQLRRLRQVRDDLLKAHDSWGTKVDDGSCSPRELQIHRRCSFLGAQIQALLLHARELECLLDDRCKDPDAKRIMSVQRVVDESGKKCDGLLEEIHELEVTKEAVEAELRRLQTRFAEQENQLRTVQKHRDQLLVETGSQKGAADETRSTVSSSSASGCSVTRPSGVDPTFLFGSAASAKPAEGQLRLSPKAPEAMGKGVKTLIHVQHLAGKELKEHWQRSATSGSRSRKNGSNVDAAPRPGGLAVPGLTLTPPEIDSQSSAFELSAPSSSQTREKSEHRESRTRERSRAKDEKAARREKRDRRHKEADLFARGYKEKKEKKTDGACDQQ
mmetsp:Transcript_114573/g.220711  ORF Transcript_114573/g.220711 Transcript_114573/m.220711 type:complete len:898 (-) Transcript_114573:34-2727(-)